MIDDFSILLSTILCVFVVFRAVRLDRSRPWYVPLKHNSDETAGPAADDGWKAPWDVSAPANQAEHVP